MVLPSSKGNMMMVAKSSENTSRRLIVRGLGIRKSILKWIEGDLNLRSTGDITRKTPFFFLIGYFNQDTFR
jgi:hypothetical protein